MNYHAKIQIGYKKILHLFRMAGFPFDGNSAKPLSFAQERASQEFIESQKKKSYYEQFRIGHSNYDYHIILPDNSYFVFWIQTSGHIKYYYYDCPINALLYPQFLYEYGFDYDEVGYTLIDDYMAYLDEAPPNTKVTPIRYDFAPNDYHRLIHPASHLHIGLREDIRIPISMFWSPFEFACFILKSFQYDEWRIAMEYDAFRNEYCMLKKYSAQLNMELFNFADRLDYYLT